jgi:hypothetical protein
MARVLATIPVVGLLAAVACVGDDPVTSNTTTGDAAAPDGGGTGDSGGDASGPLSTFCRGRSAAIGDALIFCADSDEPSEPLGGYVERVFSSSAFSKEQLLGGVATPQAGSLGADTSGLRLAIEKPANTGAQDTGARYIAAIPIREPARGLRIVFDTVVTRPAPINPLNMLGLYRASGERVMYFDANNGTPAVVGVDTNGAKALFAEGALLAIPWHVELTLDTDGTNTQYTLTGTLDGVPMKIGGGTATSHVVATAIDASSVLRIGLMSDTANDGASTGQYDNLVVQRLR